MKRVARYERLLRWYPPKWRARYGEEFVALLDDTYPTHHIPTRAALVMALNGSRERVRELGWAGDTLDRQERLRAGSLLVACSWSLFVVAGAIFAKFSEHWSATTPPVARTAASVGYDAVQWSGVVGVTVVFLAALLVAPSFVRFLRHGGWSTLGPTIIRTLTFVGVFAAATAALGVWAHHLTSAQRNGGLALYAVAFLAWGLTAVALIASATATMVTSVRSLSLSAIVTRIEATLAVVLTFVMAVVTAGVATWWITEARFAPSLFGVHRGVGIASVTASLPPALVVSGVLMLFGLAYAVWGSARVVRAMTLN